MVPCALLKWFVRMDGTGGICKGRWKCFLEGRPSGRDGLTWDGWGRDTRGPEGLVGKCMCRVVV
jgi:hypothetical protein